MLVPIPVIGSSVLAVPASFCLRIRVTVWNDAEVAGKFVIETIPTAPDLKIVRKDCSSLQYQC